MTRLAFSALLAAYRVGAAFEVSAVHIMTVVVITAVVVPALGVRAATLHMIAESVEAFRLRRTEAAFLAADRIGAALQYSAVHLYAYGAYTTVALLALVISGTTFVYTHASRAMTARQTLIVTCAAVLLVGHQVYTFGPAPGRTFGAVGVVGAVGDEHDTGQYENTFRQPSHEGTPSSLSILPQETGG